MVPSITPPEIVNAPVPIAEAVLIFRVPELKVVPPLYVLVPFNVNVRVPVKVEGSLPDTAIEICARLIITLPLPFIMSALLQQLWEEYNHQITQYYYLRH